MKKIFFFSILLVALFAACKKSGLADDVATGEGLVDFTLKSPASGTSVVLNAAVPTTTIQVNWNPSKPGLHTAPTYTWVAALKSAPNFDAPLIEIPSDNAGKDPSLTLTYKQLDDALKAKGIADGAQTELVWTVRADNSSVKILAQNVYNLTVARFKDGASPFVLLGPASSTAAMAIDPGGAQLMKFNWTKSNPAAGGSAIKYKVLFSKTAIFSSPLFSLTAGNNGADTLATISYKAFSDTLTKYGYTDLGQATALKWTVVATSGSWNQQADYINDISVLREVRLYMPGNYQKATGNSTDDWSPADAPQLIPDSREGLKNNLYYIYIYLPANTEFKFTQGRSWDINYGGNNGVLGGGDNIKVGAAGVYRVSVNRTTMKYNVMAGRMGFVGGATSVGWNPDQVFPTAAMKNMGTNYFLGVHTFKNDEWKMIDNDQWNNGSNSVDETRSYGATGGSGTALEVNGPNMPKPAAGTYRVIWDGTDVNKVKYQMYKGLRIVGAFQGWDPGTAPDMDYLGNGKWSKTLTLSAGEFKFVSADGWDWNYGKDVTAGTLKPNGDNLNVAAGTYTITVDEYNKTYAIQ